MHPECLPQVFQVEGRRYVQVKGVDSEEFAVLLLLLLLLLMMMIVMDVM